MFILPDSSALTDQESFEIQAREELLANGWATLLKAKYKIRPTSMEAVKYLEKCSLRQKIVSGKIKEWKQEKDSQFLLVESNDD